MVPAERTEGPVTLLRKPLTVGLVIGLLVGSWGCASSPVWPPSEEVRAQLGTVGVASPGVVPESALQGPTSGKVSGAAKGAGLAAAGTFVGFALGGARTGDPIGLALGLALGIGLAPIAALSGSIYGAITAEPAEKVKQAEAALKSAFVDLKVREAMRDRIFQVARDRTSHQFVLLAERPPDTPGEKTDEGSRAGAGVDTVLEVSVSSVALVAPPAVNPPLALIVQVCARLVRTADRAELYPSGGDGPPALAYASAPRRFVEWGAEDARLFREEMERASQSLAEKIVDELFLVYLPPGPRWSTSDVVSQLTAGRCVRGWTQ